ncbi:MAG: response regulator [Desulfomonile sp.]|nr:response regulator [Desulfomonile sp.]
MTTTWPKSILLADDDPDVLLGLAKCLARAGFAVTTAGDGAEAANLLHSKLFDVIITDVRMPHMNGLALLDWVRNNHPDTCVVVMTAFNSPYLKDLCVSKGAALLLEKPFDPNMLISALSGALPRGPSG